MLRTNVSSPGRGSMLLMLPIMLVLMMVTPVLGAYETAPAAAPPSLTAQSSILVNTDTGEVLWGQNQHARRSMASTAKLMTALVALALADPDEIATVQAKHLAPHSTAGLYSGEQISIRALLHALLLPSDNAAGNVIADHVGRKYLGGGTTGGIKAFVRAMNERAQQMGLTNTRYESPFGNRTRTGTYSSAYDLAQIGRAVLQDPLLTRIVASSTDQVIGSLNRAPVYHDLVNTNRNLCEYAGTYGIKTGWNDWSGQVLVAANRRGGVGLTAVVMGSSDSFADMRALFTWGYAQSGETAPAIATCQEASSRIAYAGTWARFYHDTYSGGYVRYASAAGATARFRFTGGSISWIAPKNVNRGQAAVYLDGVRAATVDLYASEYQPQQVIFTRSSLSGSAPHTLEIRVLSTKHPSSSGTRVDVDAFVVQGTAASGTITDTVNLRAGPSTAQPVLRVIPSGAQVAINSGPYNDVWYNVTYRGTRGYVHGDYLRQDIATSGTTTATVNLRTGPGTTQRVLRVIPPGAQVSVHNGPYNDVWYAVTYRSTRGYVHGDYLWQGTLASGTTTAEVNLRAGPSTGQAVLRLLPVGAQVTVHGEPYNGVWYDVTYRDTRGYIHGDYLKQ